MSLESKDNNAAELAAAELTTAELGPHFSTEGDSAELAAWTEIEAGRFLPRRVRGSNLGRALG